MDLDPDSDPGMDPDPDWYSALNVGSRINKSGSETLQKLVNDCRYEGRTEPAMIFYCTVRH
jgi:hypothetical protein